MDALNDAWRAAFWSQRYDRWDEILPARATQYLPNPAHELDYRRFMSDSMIDHYRQQKAILAGGAPLTTNFVLGGWVPLDHAAFAREVDLVAIARGWARAAGCSWSTHPARSTPTGSSSHCPGLDHRGGRDLPGPRRGRHRVLR